MRSFLAVNFFLKPGTPISWLRAAWPVARVEAPAYAVRACGITPGDVRVRGLVRSLWLPEQIRHVAPSALVGCLPRRVYAALWQAPA